MRVTATRQLTFCAGHRVLGHEGKCAHLHGHNYVVEVTAEQEVPWSSVSPLDGIGRVIDFSVLKEKVGGWLDAFWDHGFILNEQDLAVVEALDAFRDTDGKESKQFRLPDNPTAENMARYLLEDVCPAVLKGTGVRVTKVRVVETENCWAEVTL